MRLEEKRQKRMRKEIKLRFTLQKQVLGTRAFNVETVSREDSLDLPVKKSLELCQRGSSVIQ